MPGALTPGILKGPLMHIQVKRAKGRITIRIRIGDMTITLDLPL